MRISDWSSDVCSSDLAAQRAVDLRLRRIDPARPFQGRRCHRDRRVRGGRQARRGRVPPPRTDRARKGRLPRRGRSEEHTSELQSLMRISYAVFCLKKKTKNTKQTNIITSDKIITTIPPSTK